MPRLFEGSQFNKQVTLLVLLCIFYNPLLAIINGNLFSIGRSIAVATEVLLICSLFVMIVHQGFKRSDTLPVGLLIVFVFTSLLITLFNSSLFIDAIRNILIISVFTMVGLRISETSLHTIFLVVALCVLFFLIIEIFSIKSYVTIFQPASYYANTRGQAVSEFNELGIFNAAMSFSGRFTFGVFNTPRTSSLFLEQVSIGNFASILSIYLMVFWDNIDKKRSYFYICLILLILLSSVSRAATAMSLLMLLGYWFAPKLPKYSSILIIPVILLISSIMVSTYTASYSTYGDTFVGRVILGMGDLFNLEFSEYFGFNSAILNRLWDSGFAYLVVSGTIFGALALWLYAAFIIPQNSPRALRSAFGINAYLFLSIVVSGNSIYSIKTATLLWLIVGLVCRLDAKSSENSLINDDSFRITSQVKLNIQ